MPRHNKRPDISPFKWRHIANSHMSYSPVPQIACVVLWAVHFRHRTHEVRSRGKKRTTRRRRRWCDNMSNVKYTGHPQLMQPVLLKSSIKRENESCSRESCSRERGKDNDERERRWRQRMGGLRKQGEERVMGRRRGEMNVHDTW